MVNIKVFVTHIVVKSSLIHFQRLHQLIVFQLWKQNITIQVLYVTKQTQYENHQHASSQPGQHFDQSLDH